MLQAQSITLSDIAQRLRLDKSSVSLALRDSPEISDATKARVRALATELGYRPNLAARQLKSGRSHVVGLILSPSFASLHSTVVVRAIQALVGLSAQRNWLFSMLPGSELSGMLEGDHPSLFADGVLAWGDVAATQLQPLLDHRRPVVVLDPNHPTLAELSCPRVCIDNQRGAAQIAAHLAERGAARLLFVRGQRDHLGHEERWAGARAAWIERRPLHTITHCGLNELTDDHLRAFAATPDGAIFGSNDQAAMNVWHRLARLGISVPGQVRLAGFDGDAYGEQVGLTTAMFDPERLALAAVEALENRWKENQDADQDVDEEVRVPVSIRIGETS